MLNLTPTQARAIRHMEVVTAFIGPRYNYTSGQSVKGMDCEDHHKNVAPKYANLTPMLPADRARLRLAIGSRPVTHVAVEIGMDDGTLQGALRGFKMSDRTKAKVLAWLEKAI